MSASGSNLRLTYIEESTWGVTPATPQMKVIAGVTSESLGGSQEALVSQALNPNRGTDYSSPGQKQAGGDVSFELNVSSACSLIGAMLGNVSTTDNLDGTYTHEVTVAQGPKSLTIEKWLSDIGVGFVFNGCKPNTFNLSVDPNGIATGSIGMLAKSYSDTATTLDSTPTFVSHAFHDGIRASVEIGGTAYNDLSNLSMDATNNLEDSRAIGSDSSTGLTPGRFEANGNFTLPLTLDKAMPLIVKAKNGTEDSLKVTFTNGTSFVEFLFPRIKYSGDPVPKVGGAGTINLELSFTALLDNTPASPTYQKAIRIRVKNTEANLI